MAKRTPTTKDIALLHQLYSSGQLNLAPEFQRNSVWPKKAKAYLIDTILHDRPMPLFFFQRGRSAQSGKPSYSVIDGQQRLRAIFDYLENRFALTESKGEAYQGKRFSELGTRFQEQIWNYDIVIDELSQYHDTDIQDIFVRMNKYVVKLSPQELRHALGEGVFHEYAEQVGRWPFWSDAQVFTPAQIRRMRPVEFAAELAILLVEGPQDKKSAVDLYYGRYQTEFPDRSSIEKRLTTYFDWAVGTIPKFAASRYRRPVDLYALVGALDEVSEGKKLSKLRRKSLGTAFARFERETKRENLRGNAAQYVIAASRQTDNIAPRRTRINILAEILRSN